VIVYFPYIIGLAYAACISPTSLPGSLLLDHAWIFLMGSIILRGAGCTWDDIVDQDLDRQVARCRVRPIARGAVSTAQGLLFTAGQFTIGVSILYLLPWQCSVDAGVITLLSLTYPYLKRFTNYTQVILGLTIGFAIIMAAHSLDVDPFSRHTFTPTLCLWFAIAILMMLYDIIYAGQDTEDDVKAGVKSMAVQFRNSIRVLVSALAFVIIVLLTAVGLSADLSYVYFIITVGGTCWSLYSMIGLMDLKSASSFAKFCKIAYVLTSVSILGGFSAEYVGVMYASGWT